MSLCAPACRNGEGGAVVFCRLKQLFYGRRGYERIVGWRQQDALRFLLREIAHAGARRSKHPARIFSIVNFGGPFAGKAVKRKIPVVPGDDGYLVGARRFQAAYYADKRGQPLDLEQGLEGSHP